MIERSRNEITVTDSDGDRLMVTIEEDDNDQPAIFVGSWSPLDDLGSYVTATDLRALADEIDPQEPPTKTDEPDVQEWARVLGDFGQTLFSVPVDEPSPAKEIDPVRIEAMKQAREIVGGGGFTPRAVDDYLAVATWLLGLDEIARAHAIAGAC